MSKPYLAVLVMGLTCLVGGCGVENGGGGGVPTHGSTDAGAGSSNGCPSVSVTPGHGVAVDYVDFVEANGMQYVVPENLGVAPVPVRAADIGAVQFVVRCALSELNRRTSQMPPPARDGDAAFLPAGTPVHAVNGWSPSCRLAAQHDGAWHVYLAMDMHSSRGRPQPCAVTAT